MKCAKTVRIKIDKFSCNWRDRDRGTEKIKIHCCLIFPLNDQIIRLVIVACACTEIKLAIYRHVARHNLSLRPQLKLVNKSGNLNSTVLFVLLLESK